MKHLRCDISNPVKTRVSERRSNNLRNKLSIAVLLKSRWLWLGRGLRIQKTLPLLLPFPVNGIRLLLLNREVLLLSLFLKCHWTQTIEAKSLGTKYQVIKIILPTLLIIFPSPFHSCCCKDGDTILWGGRLNWASSLGKFDL